MSLEPPSEHGLDLSQESPVNQRIFQDIHSGKGVIPYGGNVDKEFPTVQWKAFGHIPTERIAMHAKSDTASIIGSVPSPLHVPPMADRIFGIDIADAEAAGVLSNELWNKYRDVLVGGKSSE